MKQLVKFATGITFEHLNPHNFALKNDFVSHLLYTGLSILPVLNKLVNEIKVTKGFISHSYMLCNTPELVKIPHMLQHCKGLGIEVTYDCFDPAGAIFIAQEVLDSVSDPLLAVIDSENETIGFYFGSVKKSEIKEKTLEESRTIFKE